MPVIPGSNPGTIKSYSYEFYTTPDGTEICEDCVDFQRISGQEDAYTDDELHPIFADTEVSSTPVCDVCGRTTDVCTVLE